MPFTMFCSAINEDFADLDAYSRTRSNPYGISYEKVCEEVMGSRQKEQLRKMIGFRFQRHPRMNLPEEHLAAIEQHLQARIRTLLAIPAHRRKK